MKKYFLDKLIDVGTLYRAETDKAFVIKKIGTSSAGRATLNVAGVPVVEINNVVAPNFTTDSNLNGPIDLGNLYIVVPQSKTFSFTGDANSTMRLIGDIIEFEPGEALPSDLAGRWTAQGRKYLTYLSDTKSFSAGTNITAGSETEVLKFTVPVAERYVLNRTYMAEAVLDDGTLVPQFYSRIYVNGKPYDIIETTMGKLGISGQSAPHPPRDPVNREAFTFKEKPLVLEAGTDLSIRFVNTGSAYTVPTGRTLYMKVTIVAEKELL